MRLPLALTTLCSLTLAACSSSGVGLSTSSLFGSGSPEPVAAQAPPAPTSDPTTRAFGVGSVAARAMKCGYNFDPNTLRANYLASEATLAGPQADLSKVEKIYDAAFNGVSKAVAGDAAYCTNERTKEIKATLGRHLAGDFSPVPLKVASPDSGGIFSGIFSGAPTDKGLSTIKPSTANEY